MKNFGKTTDIKDIITVGYEADNAVLYSTSQSLTNNQKAQARTNIGAGTSSFDGNYNSLSNKPTIPTKTSQLNNDSYFATTSQVEAKYTKPAGGIPKTDLATAVQNSLTAADNAVKYTSQSLTDAQKVQARTNIGAGTSNFSGSYNDLTNRPTIPAAVSIVQSTGTSTSSVMSQKATTDAVNGKLSKTDNTNIEVLGTKKATTTLGGNQLYAPNGVIFGGTAAAAGLLTRGISGIGVPTAGGACSKDNLYINYDGNNDFNADRQIVLNAGTTGSHLGSNMYQYTVPRGDIVKNWVEAKGYATSVKVNGNTIASSGGVIDIGTVVTDVSGKLDKTPYEVNKTINFGNSGALCIGKFKVYDTNVTCEITSTTSVTYSGKLVIATQNNVIKQMTVYGDAANTVAPNIYIKPSSESDPYIEVYFKPESWSKNVVHIYGSAIAAEPTNVCTNVSAVPATATSKPTNALNSKANLLGGNTFKGGQEITRDDTGTLLAVINNVGDSFFQINQNANSSDGSIFIGMDTAQTPISFDGDFGLEGQALLSLGSENTPMWGDIAKHGYIELTNENLSTIKKVGWYRAAANNSCTAKPSPIGTNQFLLLVEQLSDGTTKQTCYRLDANVYEQLSTAYVRYINPNSGASGWYPMTLVHNASQTFLGRKTFSDGIELKNSLQVSGSSGTAGQVLTSTGAGTPQWKTPSSSGSSNVIVSIINIQGVSYTVFNNNEYGSFIGVFDLETNEGNIKITIGSATYTITGADSNLYCKITIDKTANFTYSTIVVDSGSVDKQSIFSSNASQGVVSIGTDLASSYYESNSCVIMKG